MVFEVALLWVVCLIFITALFTVGRPITKAITEKMAYKYRELGSESETELRQKVSFLESEVLSMKQQVQELQQSVDFAIKQGQSSSAGTIKLTEKDKQT